MNKSLIYKLVDKKVETFYRFTLMLSLIAFFASLPSFFIYSEQDTTYSFSTLRILFTIIFFYLIRNKPNLNEKIVNFISYFMIFNSLIIVANFFYPGISKFISSFTYVSGGEFFRFAGFWGSFQLPSYLYILQLILIKDLPRLHFTSLLASISLSRALLPVVFFTSFYRIIPKFLEKKSYEKLFILVLLIATIIPAIYFLYSTLSIYVEARLIPILFMEDSSVQGTFLQLSKFLHFESIFDNLFGRNIARFTLEGGEDPFYSRWYVGSGLLTLIPLELIKLRLSFSIFFNKKKSLLFYLFMLYVDIKGDLVLTAIALIFILAIYNRNNYLFRIDPKL